MIYVVGGAVYTLPDYSSNFDKPIVDNKETESISYYCTISDFIFYLDNQICFCQGYRDILHKLKLKELKRLRSFYLKYLKDSFKKNNYKGVKKI